MPSMRLDAEAALAAIARNDLPASAATWVPCWGAVDRAVDQAGGFLGRVSRSLSQVADFIGYHGEALALFSCPRSFNRRVQSQEVGLERDLPRSLWRSC